MSIVSGKDLQVLNDTGSGLFLCHSFVIFEHSDFKIYVDDNNLFSYRMPLK